MRHFLKSYLVSYSNKSIGGGASRYLSASSKCVELANARMINKTCNIIRSENPKKIFVSFFYWDSCVSAEVFHLNRPADELLKYCLSRLTKNLMNAAHVGKKKKRIYKRAISNTNPDEFLKNDSDDETDLVNVEYDIQVRKKKNYLNVEQDDIDVLDAESCFNKDAFVPGNYLVINDFCYEMHENLPHVISVSFPDYIMVGCSVYPKLEVEYCSDDDCLYFWMKSNNSKTPRASYATEILKLDETAYNKLLKETKLPSTVITKWIEELHGAFDFDNWEIVSRKRGFSPKNENFGNSLKIVCIPHNKENGEYGAPKAFCSQGILESSVFWAPQGGLPALKREFREVCDRYEGFNKFKLISYNILADLHPDVNYKHRGFYSYCPLLALDISYRQQLLREELRHYTADVYCLQEVNHAVFQSDLKPFFQDMGFTCFISASNDRAQTIATFVRKCKFKQIYSQAFCMNQVMLEDWNAEFWKEVKATSEILADKMLKYPQSFHLLCLKLTTEYVFIINTHLYWSPKCPHHRLLQIKCIMDKTYQEISKLREQHPDIPEKPSVILSGDLNSSEDRGVNALLTSESSSLPSDYSEWECLQKLERRNNGIEVKLPEILSIFSHPCISFYPFTMNVPEYRGRLDWVYYKGDVVLTKILSMPLRKDLKQWLPNPVMPSDHLAIGAQFLLLGKDVVRK